MEPYVSIRDFIVEIAGEYEPKSDIDGNVLNGIESLDFTTLAAYAVIIIIMWWILHLINNILFARRR